MKLKNWFDLLFYCMAPFGIAASLYNGLPLLAVGMAFCFGNLFQIDLRRWIESQETAE